MLAGAAFRLCFLTVFCALSFEVNGQNETDPVPASKIPLEKFNVYSNVVYAGTNEPEQRINLFVPAKGDGPFPLIVWIHGGAWRKGSYADGCRPLTSLNSTDYAYASIGYRLSGTAPFPAQIEDCKAAVRWLRANAKQYNLDPDRIGAWGASAGGHLAVMLGVAGDVKEFDAGENPDMSSKVQAVCDFFGPVDLLAWPKTAGWEATILKEFLGGMVLEVPDRVVRASPLAYVRKDADFPPFLIVQGEKDKVVPPAQSQLLYDALIRVKADAELMPVPGAGHGGEAFLDVKVRSGVKEFFDRYLLKNKS